MLTTQELLSVDADAFWKRVKKGPGCWEWTGSLDRYGSVRVPAARTTTTAHRVALVLSGGAIPGGYEVDHLCRNTACVRPDHLEAVTPGENSRRARKELCLRGHPKPGGGDKRRCPICKVELQRARRAAYRAANPPKPLGWASSSKTHCPTGATSRPGRASQADQRGGDRMSAPTPEGQHRDHRHPDTAMGECRECYLVRAACRRKTRNKGQFQSAEKAHREALRRNIVNGWGRPLVPYRCPICSLWHLTTANTKARQKRAEKMRRTTLALAASVVNDSGPTP